MGGKKAPAIDVRSPFPKDIQFQGVAFQTVEKTQELQWVFVYQSGGINQLGKNPCGFLESFPI